MNRALKHIILFVLFLLIQVFVLRGMAFWNAVPLLYVYVVLIWPSNMPRWLQVLCGFLLGLLIDIFCDTLGMNAMATTLIAYLRQPLLVTFGNIDNGVIEPGERSMGFLPFWKYVLSMVSLHHVVLFVAESFSLFKPGLLLLRIVGSILLTLILVFVMERFRRRS